MTKINQEEYEVLKALDDKWKYLARNNMYGAKLEAHTSQPYKMTDSHWSNGDMTLELLGGEHLFQFIQWEDEKPYNIDELIEEYEDKEFYDYVGWEHYKGEETEVNKDIQWLKREIHKELESWHGVEGGIDGDGINEIMSLINQHEESEVKRLERKIKELDSYNDELIRDNNQFRNELDNQEVLSQEWIDKHSYNVHLLGTPDVTTVAVPREDLQNLIVPKQEITYEEALKVIAENIDTDEFSIGLYLEALSNNEKYEFLTEKWIEDNTSPVDEEGRLYVWKRDLQNVIVPKQELPVIPKFVAEWIKENKRQNRSLVFAITHIYDENEIGKSPKIFIWMESDDNEEVFARAWLFGFTVEEEEPLYRARLKVITNEFIASYLCTQSSDTEDRLKALEIGSKYIHEDYRHLSEFTEDELKRLDIWDSEQWEIEELEE